MNGTNQRNIVYSIYTIVDFSTIVVFSTQNIGASIRKNKNLKVRKIKLEEKKYNCGEKNNNT